MRRSALEEERRNSRHMNLELSMADASSVVLTKTQRKTVAPRWNVCDQNQMNPHKAVVSWNPGRSGEGGVTPEQPVGVRCSRVERPMQSLCHKSLFVEINPGFRSFGFFIDQDQTATSCGRVWVDRSDRRLLRKALMASCRSTLLCRFCQANDPTPECPSHSGAGNWDPASWLVHTLLDWLGNRPT